MRYAILFFLMVFGAPIFIEAQTPIWPPAGIRKHAKEAFAEMDSAVVKFEKAQQAEFRLLVEKELALLKIQIGESSLSDTTKGRVLTIAQHYGAKVLADTVATAQAKRAQFIEFMDYVRTKFELVKATTADSTKVAGVKDTTTVGGIPVIMSSSPAVVNLVKTYEEADWVKNCDAVPKDWWKKAQPWLSKDGKVAFAVGSWEGRNIGLAYTAAAMKAREVFVKGVDLGGGKTLKCYVGPVARIIRQAEKDGVAYVLAAIPTALLQP